MAWPTAQSVLSQAAVELGLVQSPDDLGDNAYDSTDANVIQLRHLLKKVGRDLVAEAQWTQLRQEYSILTESAADATTNSHQTLGAFVLPADFAEMLDQTGWNRTNRLPLGGALSEQEWQYLASRLAGVVWTVLFKPKQGLFWLYPSTSTPAGQAITFAYKSSWWVQDVTAALALTYSSADDVLAGELAQGIGAGGSIVGQLYRCVQPGTTGASGDPDPAASTSPYLPTTSGALVDGTVVWNWMGALILTADGYGMSCGNSGTPSHGANQLMFDEELLVAGVKYEWLNAKGFDSTNAWSEFQDALERAKGADSPSPILSLNGTGVVRDRLLGTLNIPITGFGS